MRFAFLIMGKFDSREDQAVIHNGTARIIGVSDLEDAARTAKRLEEEGSTASSSAVRSGKRAPGQ